MCEYGVPGSIIRVFLEKKYFRYLMYWDFILVA